MMIWTILTNLIMGTLFLMIVYMFYITIRNDIREEKERKAKKKEKDGESTPLRRSR